MPNVATCSTKPYFPKGFQPRDYDVIIGRGKKCYKHAGNQALLLLVTLKLDMYSKASTKFDKSVIIDSVVAQVRNPGSFIKEDAKTELWYDVGDEVARKKVAQTFRDTLHEHYSSSYIRKNKKRSRALLETKEEHNVPQQRLSLFRMFGNAPYAQAQIAPCVNNGDFNRYLVLFNSVPKNGT